MTTGARGLRRLHAGAHLRRVAPVLLAAAGLVPASAAGQDADGVTIYRCTDDRGHLVALRDSPCREGERQEEVRMQRPQDPPPRPVSPAPASPAPATNPLPHEIRIVTVQPPQPVYECTTPEGQTYTSDSGEGNPRWVPLWTLGHPVGAWPRPPQVRPPHPHPPSVRPPRPPMVAVPGGTWVRDACVRLPQQDVCRRLSDRRFEILRIYHAAMPSGRAELDREQARIDAQLANDCPGF